MPEQRTDNWHKLCSDSTFDVVVVGGGVNGIGTYRELALQGLRVLLIERSDFASGCSAAPSRMIHGGLRYLENGEFDLVRESLQERDALLLNAPHVVHPLPTVIPVTSLCSGMFNAAASFLGLSSKPAPRGAVPIKLGLSLYDWVSRKRRLMPKHSFQGRRETRRNWPELTERARGTATYHDAWIGFPERLCIEMLQDVARDAPGCVALNYCEITAQEGGFAVTCQRSGQTTPVRPRLIVNATGAWLNETATQLGGSAKRMVEGTKGSHLILDHPGLFAALKGNMVFFENDDGRVCIVFPFHDRVLVGSTDIRVARAGRVRCEPEETEYILTALSNVFPRLRIDASHIVFSFSGIRPLPQSDQDFTGRISRGHDIRRLDAAVPQLCMIGGKWTTFRAFAQQTADAALAELCESRRVATLKRPIGGGAEFAGRAEQITQELRARHGLSAARARHLLQRYGSHSLLVAAACGPDDRPLAGGTLYSSAEIQHLIRTEFVETLSDLALRRTDLAISGQLSMQIIDALARLLAQETAMPLDQIKAQKIALIEELKTFHGVTAATLERRNTERNAQCA